MPSHIDHLAGNGVHITQSPNRTYGREAVYFWWGAELMACRMRQFKAHVKVVLPKWTHKYIDHATAVDVGLAPWFFDLYLDPKEEMTVGHRMSPWLATVGSKLKAHGGTFRKYPPKNIGL